MSEQILSKHVGQMARNMSLEDLIWEGRRLQSEAPAEMAQRDAEARAERDEQCRKLMAWAWSWLPAAVHEYVAIGEWKDYHTMNLMIAVPGCAPIQFDVIAKVDLTKDHFALERQEVFDVLEYQVGDVDGDYQPIPMVAGSFQYLEQALARARDVGETFEQAMQDAKGMNAQMLRMEPVYEDVLDDAGDDTYGLGGQLLMTVQAIVQAELGRIYTAQGEMGRSRSAGLLPGQMRQWAGK